MADRFVTAASSQVGSDPSSANPKGTSKEVNYQGARIVTPVVENGPRTASLHDGLSQYSSLPAVDDRGCRLPDPGQNELGQGPAEQPEPKLEVEAYRHSDSPSRDGRLRSLSELA